MLPQLSQERSSRGVGYRCSSGDPARSERNVIRLRVQIGIGIFRSLPLRRGRLFAQVLVNCELSQGSGKVYGQSCIRSLNCYLLPSLSMTAKLVAKNG